MYYTTVQYIVRGFWHVCLMEAYCKWILSGQFCDRNMLVFPFQQQNPSEYLQYVQHITILQQQPQHRVLSQLQPYTTIQVTVGAVSTSEHYQLIVPIINVYNVFTEGTSGNLHA